MDVTDKIDDNEKMVTSDDEDDSSSSDEEEKKLENRASDLEKQISDNKYLYDVHTELVDLYRKLGDLKSMRAAYERFSEYFPLTPSIWLMWIRDEIKLANSSSEKKYVLSLFDKAVEDYLSTDVWLEYVQFSIGNCELEQTYSILERGLNAVGLNTNQGSLLWDALRELELAHLSLHEKLSDDWRQQANKVADAFRRQLSVPLLGMENTYVEWQQWLEQLPADHGIDSKSVEWGYQKASKLLTNYKPMEEHLLTAEGDEEVFTIYQEYINTVTDPATILCLYERAISQLSLNTTLWSKYCSYTFNLGDISYSITKRALRNCPWCEELWIMHLRVLEQQGHSNKEAMDCLEQGLTAIVPSPGLNLWLSYLECIRRSGDSAEHLHKLFTQASEQLGPNGDPTCKILRLQARLYARQENMAKARRVWSHILHNHSHKGTATAWLEYASLEKQYGDPHYLRTLYQRAISSCEDWPQYIAEDWLMYERECGTLTDVLECEEKCRHIINVQVNEELNNKGQTKASESRKRAHESKDRNGKIKRSKTADKSKQVLPKTKILVSDIDSEKAVFISNMREDVNEETLQEMFPNANAICIPSDRKGNSRCYAYVQFSEQKEVEKALSRDREPLDGRPLFISKCLLDQTQRKSYFKYSTHSEENKLFVRGLPISYTQEDIDGVFKPYGAVAVRLVAHRSGRSKGLAYIEFNNQEKAREALKATDQMNVAGHTITVAISAPPPKKTSADILTDFAPVRHARSRLQLPLIPRSVQTKKPEAASQGATKTNEDFRKMLLNTTKT